MAFRSAHARVRRVVGVFAAVVVLGSVPLAAPARADTYVDWSGSFVGASADSPLVSVGATAVRFTVSQELQVPGTVGAYVVIRDASSVQVKACTSGTECMTASDPDAGTTQTYTAELRTQRNGQTVVIETAGPVTVTDPGWLGGFSYAYADNASPVLSESTAVRFGFTQPLSGASVTVTDDAGRFVRTCSSGTACLVAANPAAGMTTSYTARLYVQLAGRMVERDARTVSVTDPGWRGTISPAGTNKGFVEAGALATVSFDVSTPLDAASVEIFVDGKYERSCGSKNRPSSCGINVRFSNAPLHAVKAVVQAQRASGWQEVSSVTMYVSTFTPEAFANWMLDPDVDHGGLEYLPVSAALAGLGTRVASEEFCLAVGQALPTYEYGSTVPDFTLDCTAGALTVGQVFALAMRAAGVVGAIELVNTIASSTSPHQGTIAGGGTADHTPNGQGDPGCLSFDFAGNCIDAWGLAAQGTERVSYVVDPPQYWGGLLCSATHVDPVTGEETVYTLTGDGLRHILEDHASNPGNGESIWDSQRFYGDVDPGELANFEEDLLPKDFEGLVQFICSSLADAHLAGSGPSAEPGSLNSVRLYDREGIVGTDKSGSDATNYTLIITPEGQVWSAYPGVSAYLPVEGN